MATKKKTRKIETVETCCNHEEEKQSTVFVKIKSSSKYDRLIFRGFIVDKKSFIEVSSEILLVEKFKKMLDLKQI